MGQNEDTNSKDLKKERLVLLLVLGGSVVLAPFCIVEWTIFAVVSLLALQVWQWLFPEVASFEVRKHRASTEVKKRVKIIEHKNLYITQVTDDSEPTSASFASDGTPKQAAPVRESSPPDLEARTYEDIRAKVTGLRISGAGCTGSADAEYKLQIESPDGKTWRVWRNYEDIHRVHALVERILESDKTRNSVFTRVVPSIPSKNFSSVGLLFESRRSIMHRRRTGLDEFVSRIFGDKSAEHYRKLALKIPQVRDFLELSKTETQFPKRALRRRKSNWLSNMFLFRKQQKSRPKANSYYMSSESSE